MTSEEWREFSVLKAKRANYPLSISAPSFSRAWVCYGMTRSCQTSLRRLRYESTPLLQYVTILLRRAPFDLIVRLLQFTPPVFHRSIN